MRKSISKITELAREAVEADNSLIVCENCKHYTAFTDAQVTVIVPVLGEKVKGCGICSFSTLPNDEPLIINGQTNQTDAEFVHGEKNCFEWDSAKFNMHAESVYNGIEPNYWE